MTTTALQPASSPYRMAMGTLTDPETLGRLLAASGYFDDTKDAAQAVVKVLAGAELGFGPIASMTGVYIVKGKVTMSANLMAASIKRWKPRYNYKVRDLSNDRAVVVFFEDGEEAGTSEFTMADAHTAGLDRSDNYRKFPRNMLFARAMSNGAKFYCPDVFAGAPVYTPDELGAEIDPETGELRHVETPVGTMDTQTGEIIDAAPTSADTGSSPVAESTSGASAAATEHSPPSTTTIENLTDANVNDPVTDAEVAKLRELLDTVGAPDAFRRMALMTYGAEDLANLTRQQAAEVADKAVSRFGG